MKIEISIELMVPDSCDEQDPIALHEAATETARAWQALMRGGRLSVSTKTNGMPRRETTEG